MCKKFYLLLGVSILLLTKLTYAASFNCKQASRAIDKTICGNSALSQADETLAKVYQQTMGTSTDPTAFKQAQLDWLKTRDQCKTMDCLQQAYQKRIQILQDLAKPEATTLPTKKTIANNSPQTSYPVWYSPELGLKSLAPADIEAALQRDFWQTAEEKQLIAQLRQGTPSNIDLNASIPNNCNQLQKLLVKYKINDYEEISPFLPGYYSLGAQTDSLLTNKILPLLTNTKQTNCQALRLLKFAKPAQTTYVRNLLAEKNVLHDLPALMNPNNVGCISKDDTRWENNPKASWYDQDKSDKSVRELPAIFTQDRSTFNGALANYTYQFTKNTPQELQFTIESQYGTAYQVDLKVLAWGDFLQKGFEQALLALNAIDINSNNLMYLVIKKTPNGLAEIISPKSYWVKPDYSCDKHLTIFSRNLSKQSNPKK